MSKESLIDAHVHLAFYSEIQLETVFTAAKSVGVNHWVLGGYDTEDWLRQERLSKKYPQSFTTCMGLHPWQVIELSSSEIQEQMSVLSQKLANAQACGETGLDAYRSKETLLKQEDIFRQHLELNRHFNKPLVLHIVQAHEKALEVLSQHTYKGIVHAFSGSYDVARKYVDLGYKISVGRGVYAEGYKSLKEAVQKLGLEDMVFESDAVSNKDLVEDPVDILLKVIAAVAEIKGISRGDLIEANEKNLKQIFDAV